MPTLAITMPTLPNWDEQLAYNQTINASGGVGTVNFSSTGTLPAGLSLSTSGVLSGTPTTTGSYTFTVTATDSTSATASQSYTVTINPPVTITTTALSGGHVAVPYSQTIMATGGTASLRFFKIGTLPTGLTLTTTGVLSGTPTTPGNFSFAIRALDTINSFATQNYTVNITALAITTTSVSNWTVNQPGYSQTINVANSIGSPTFSATGSLPTGLTLSTSGVVSGTPTIAGQYTFTVTAMDSVGESVSQRYTITINPTITFGLTTHTIAYFGGGTDGSNPLAGLIKDDNGNLFGTTQLGGASYDPTHLLYGYGTVFEIPKGSSTISILASFNGVDGAGPGDVVLDSSGNLFGITGGGGMGFDLVIDNSGYGTIYEVPAGTNTITVLASFDGTNGVGPNDLIVDRSGNIFGTTGYGGLGFTGNRFTGNGTVFELQHGSHSITTLAYFNSFDGAGPFGDLIEDNSGDLYGTTQRGGSTSSGSLLNDGTVFEVKVDSGTITTVATFDGSNGSVPSALAMDGAGNLFGTASNGGAFSKGTVFEVAVGSGTVTTIVDFNGSNGATPSGGLILNGDGDLIGSTTGGGPWGKGTLYRLPGGVGPLQTIATFNQATSTNGDLVEHDSGDVLGTGYQGGLGAFPGNGTVYEVLSKISSWDVNQPGYDQTLTASGGTGPLSFTESGALPPGLTLGPSGTLAGTPIMAGSFTFTVTASDMTGATGSKSYTLVINGPVTIATSSLANGEVNMPYNQSVTVTGGTGSYAFSQSSGTLPAGLTLSSNGLLSGIPTTTGTYTFTVTVTDSAGGNASQSYTVGIVKPASPVYVDPSFTGPDGSDPSTDPGLGLTIGTNAFATITDALPHVTSGGTLVIFAGTYTEPSVNFNVPLTAVDIATNPSDSPVGSTVQFDNVVTVTDTTVFDMTGVATGTGSSVAANLDLISTEAGAGAMSVTGAAGVNFGGEVSGMVYLFDSGGAPVLNPTGTLTLVGSGTFTVGPGLSETTGELVSPSNNTTVALQASTLSVDGTGSSTFAGKVSSGGTLNKLGPATTLTLTGIDRLFKGTINVVGTLVVNGTLGASASPVNLISPSSVLEGNGTVNMPVVVTGAASGAVITGTGGTLNIVNGSAGIGIDVQAGANNVSISNVTVSVAFIGILLEPGDGNMTSVIGNTINGNVIGVEPLNGCLTVEGNLINGVNTGVEIPATNPHNASLRVDPLLTLEGNDLSSNSSLGLMNATSMGVTAILNWWGSASGNAVAAQMSGVSVDNYTPYALNATSVGPDPTTFSFFNGTGTDGNVYVTGTQDQDTITANVDLTNSNLVHVTVNGTTSNYLRDGASNRIIIYGFGDDNSGSSDSITVSNDSATAPLNAQINAEIQLAYREPASFTGPSRSTITTTGLGSDVIFGGGNDIINALSHGNNVLVAGKSMGKTGSPTAPRLSGGSSNNIYIAGYVDCTLASLASTGRLDYEALRAIDDMWAAGAGGMAGAMADAALYSVVNTPGAIETGSARVMIIPGSGKSWYITKGAGNPINTPAGANSDYVARLTTSPNYRQAIQ